MSDEARRKEVYWILHQLLFSGDADDVGYAVGVKLVVNAVDV
jgi:hypothetical protein